jgi:hypothetical protein
MKKMTPIQRRNITMPTIEQAISNNVIAMNWKGKARHTLTGSAAGWEILRSSSRRAGVRLGLTV